MSPIGSHRTRRVAFGVAAGLFALSLVLATREARVWGMASFSLCLGVLAFAAVAIPGRAPARELGLASSRLGWRERIAAIALGLLWLGLAPSFFSLPTDAAFPADSAVATGAGLRGVLGVVASGLANVLLPASGEELFFRGFLQRALAAPIGPGLAILASSIAFAALHVGPGAIAFAFLTSLLLGVLVHLSGSLWESIGLHAANNALVFAASI